MLSMAVALYQAKTGSADVLERLGVNIACPPEEIERLLETVGIAFFYLRQLCIRR
ncbi:hypothetical protein GCM10020331_077560 [Ectobacillus funiculus]